MYNLAFSINQPKIFLKKLGKSDKKTAVKIKNEIKDLQDDPYSKTYIMADSKCRKLRIGNYRIALDVEIMIRKLRIGNYRIALDVDNDTQIMSIYIIENRKKSYARYLTRFGKNLNFKISMFEYLRLDAEFIYVYFAGTLLFYALSYIQVRDDSLSGTRRFTFRYATIHFQVRDDSLSGTRRFTFRYVFLITLRHVFMYALSSICIIPVRL